MTAVVYNGEDGDLQAVFLPTYLKMLQENEAVIRHRVIGQAGIVVSEFMERGMSEVVLSTLLPAILALTTDVTEQASQREISRSMHMV